MAYEQITGTAAKPFYAVLEHTGNYKGDYLTEIRKIRDETTVIVHTDVSFKTLNYDSNKIELLVIAGGVQVQTILRGHYLEVTKQAWSPKLGLYGPVSPGPDLGVTPEKMNTLKRDMENKIQAYQTSKSANVA